MAIRNKKILITAGPTWVPIDSVRVIANIASGETGILLAEKLRRSGAKVTLLLGPATACCLSKEIKLLRFSFFDELKDKLARELRRKKYDIVIHSAAVSDYRPQKTYLSKVASGRKEWRINLVPTTRIIDLIKRIDRHLFAVGFKFEPGCPKGILLKEARALMQGSGVDAVVANTALQGRYSAFILSRQKAYGPFNSKDKLSDNLTSYLGTVLK
ncbi:MAG: phosphopantothenoylcysteine decarboxylase [Candidatus Omnitrophota bacterium]